MTQNSVLVSVLCTLDKNVPSPFVGWGVYKYQLGQSNWVIVLFKSPTVYSYLFVYSFNHFSERDTLKPLTIIVDLSFFSVVQLVSTHKFRTLLSVTYTINLLCFPNKLAPYCYETIIFLPVILFILKSHLSDINIASPVFFCLGLPWHIFFIFLLQTYLLSHIKLYFVFVYDI